MDLTGGRGWLGGMMFDPAMAANHGKVFLLSPSLMLWVDVVSQYQSVASVVPDWDEMPRNENMKMILIL